jgi:hypothetical protein
LTAYIVKWNTYEDVSKTYIQKSTQCRLCAEWGGIYSVAASNVSVKQTE